MLRVLTRGALSTRGAPSTHKGALSAHRAELRARSHDPVVSCQAKPPIDALHCRCQAGPVPVACRACMLCRASASSMQGQCQQHAGPVPCWASAAGYACDCDVCACVRARVGASCCIICSWLCQASAMPGQCHAGPVPCRASAMPGQCHASCSIICSWLSSCVVRSALRPAPMPIQPQRAPPGCGTHITHTGVLRACTQSQYSQYTRAGADRGRTTRA